MHWYIYWTSWHNKLFLSHLWEYSQNVHNDRINNARFISNSYRNDTLILNRKLSLSSVDNTELFKWESQSEINKRHEILNECRHLLLIVASMNILRIKIRFVNKHWCEYLTSTQQRRHPSNLVEKIQLVFNFKVWWQF